MLGSQQKMTPISDIFDTKAGSGADSVEGMSYDTEASVRNMIRSIMNREYGSIQSSAYCNGGLERDRSQLIEFIMNLRAISIAALGTVHLTESDILKVCSCIKRLELQGYKNLSFIFEFCLRRASHDYIEAYQRDPLLIRHLLTFSIDVPNYDMPQEELSLLEYQLAEGETDAMIEWFKRHADSGVLHNKGLPAYLRRYLLDHADAPLTTVKAFAFELAVLDVRLSGPVGWENTRSFLGTFCIVQDRRHDPLESYMDARDFNAGILAHQHCGDADGRTYYSMKLDRFDPADLSALEQLVFDTAARIDRGDSGPRGGKREAQAKRGWWRSIFAPASAHAQGFSAGVVSFA